MKLNPLCDFDDLDAKRRSIENGDLAWELYPVTMLIFDIFFFNFKFFVIDALGIDYFFGR